jgi:hypothetical protein
MEELAAVCHAADSYGAYKKRVSMAVRERDMQVAQTDALQQSTLACSLSAYAGTRRYCQCPTQCSLTWMALGLQ